MTCREFADFIVEYLGGALPRNAREPFERHLSRCSNCQEYLQQYQETLRAGRFAFEDPQATVPAEVPEELIQAILASRKP